MAYDDIINKNQGSIKISEIFTDRELDIVKTQVGESAIIALEQILRVSGDALRRMNYILYSPGTINWTGSVIELNNIAVLNATDIILRLLQTEDIGLVSSPRHIDLTLTGSQTTNGELTFKDMVLNNDEVIYLQLERAQVLSAGTSKPLHNGVSFGSIFSGLTVKKTTISTGLPALASSLSGSTDTFIIPLFMRIDWTDGVDSFQDLLTIPHGIRWPISTKSTLGAVVVSGSDNYYYSKIVASQAQLTQACTDLSVTGGIILIKSSITINSPLTIPEGVTLLSRSNKYGTTEGGLTLTNGASITLNNRAKLSNLDIEGTSTFGYSATEQIVILAGDKSWIDGCNFRLINTTGGEGSCIGVTGNNNTIKNCIFRLGAPVAYRIGIKYISGTNNTDTDSQFLAT